MDAANKIDLTGFGKETNMEYNPAEEAVEFMISVFILLIIVIAVYVVIKGINK